MKCFLDSADLRSSVVSLAKQVGYTPRSAEFYLANINVVVNNGVGSSITMTRGTKFTSSVNGQSYTFVNNADITVIPADGVYTFSNVDT